MVEIIIAPGASDEVVLNESDIIDYRPVLTHTGIGSLRATLATSTTLLDLARREARLNVNFAGRTEWSGYLNKIDRDRVRGTVSLEAFGVARKLEKTRPDYENISNERIEFTQIALEEALRDYWQRTPFDGYQVTDEPTEVVEDDVLLRQADDNSSWSSITSIKDTTPAYIEGGSLKLAQTAFFFEGESEFISGTFSDAEYSDGDATGFDTGISSTGDKATYTFTPEYTIPEGNIKLRFRIDLIDGDNDGDIAPPEIAVRLNGDTLFQNQFLVSQNTGLEWNDFSTDGEYNGGDLTAGSSVDIEIEVTDGTLGDPDDRINVDAVVAYDDRFSYTFDNSVDADGYLSGPALYPTSAVIETTDRGTDLNINALRLDSSWTDVSGAQQVAVSNDGGQSYQTNANSATIDATFSDGGRTAKARLTLDGYGSRSTASPTERYLGQEVASLELRGDLDNLTVIDSLELTGTHFENLKRLHDYGNFLWTIEHDSGALSTLLVRSYQEGAETRSAPAEYDDPISRRDSVDTSTYFNELFLYGARNDNDQYPSAQVADQDEIADVGEQSAVLHDPNVTTAAGARFRANSLLAALTRENTREGEITIPLRDDLVYPGYARPFGNIGWGTNWGASWGGIIRKTVEEVELVEDGDRVAQTHRFSPPTNVDSEIEALRRNARDIRDKV